MAGASWEGVGPPKEMAAGCIYMLFHAILFTFMIQNCFLFTGAVLLLVAYYPESYTEAAFCLPDNHFHRVRSPEHT